MLCAAAPRQPSRSIDATRARVVRLMSRCKESLRIDFQRTQLRVGMVQLKAKAPGSIRGKAKSDDFVGLEARPQIVAVNVQLITAVCGNFENDVVTFVNLKQRGTRHEPSTFRASSN